MSIKYTRCTNNRLTGYNCSQAGCYFVTICVEGRQQVFGTVENDKMTLNDVGKMVARTLETIPQHYSGISIDEYIVMPNHIHGIINIVGVDPRVDPNQCINPVQNDKILNNGRTQGSAPTPKLSLSNIIKCIKSLTTKKYIDGIKNNNWPPFNKRFWQRNYYDHIVRNDKTLNRIREYIINNPAKWIDDENNIKNIVGAGLPRPDNNKIIGRGNRAPTN